MNCSNCGTEIPVGNSFCPKCGTMVKLSSAGNDQKKAASGNKKSVAVDSKRLLFILAGVLVLIILVIGIVAAFTHSKGKDTEKTAQKDTEKTAQNELSPEQIAMNTVEEMWEITCSEELWRGNTYEMEHWIADHYPEDMADIFIESISAFSEQLEELDDEEVEEMLYDLDDIANFQIVSAEKLSEDDALDLRYDVMDLYDIEIPKAEWAYRVTVKASITIEGEEYESEEYVDVLCTDGKAGVYVSE